MDIEQVKICLTLSIPFFFALVITAARFVSRYIGKQRIWLDDYLIIPAFVSILRAELAVYTYILTRIEYSSARSPE
jgi:hypothetical protein